MDLLEVGSQFEDSVEELRDVVATCTRQIISHLSHVKKLSMKTKMNCTCINYHEIIRICTGV